ncbi:M16 family metallopeptidase [Pontivivens ytuae]|uniref:Insulinase family protein n=1 Tax=Pontivivens ytuae TaxID=2789856 RepID=A0A7S9LUV0_9RHOB|nr:pitrilysin family protein [Pontivivens ytuae]QPH55742.1 insulinase family protein [Pontivivens ytuae]
MIRALLTAAALLAPVAATAQIEIEEVTTPGGLTFWLQQEDTIPIVSVEVIIEGGAALDPDGFEGAAMMVAGLLNEGAGPYDASGFARASEELAARMGFDTSRERFSVSATMLRENRIEVAELVNLALTEPRFDADAVERLRAQMSSIVRSNETDPDEIASRTFFDLAFPGHPYSRPTDGTPASIAGMTVEVLRETHERVITRDAAMIAVVGDVTPEEASELVDTMLDGLPEGGGRAPEPVDLRFTGDTVVVPLPSPQSQTLFGHGGIARDDPDFVPAFVLNHILGGGGFSSRLTEEVRVERGLTYGISTFLATLEDGPLYLGSVASANGTVAEAIDIVRAEWERMRADGVTEEELDAAKRFLTGAYPLRFDSNASIARILVGLQDAGLPIDYTLTRNDLIEAVTLEDLDRVAERILDPEALTFVVVGQPEGL